MCWQPHQLCPLCPVNSGDLTSSWRLLALLDVNFLPRGLQRRADVMMQRNMKISFSSTFDADVSRILCTSIYEYKLSDIVGGLSSHFGLSLISWWLFGKTDVRLDWQGRDYDPSITFFSPGEINFKRGKAFSGNILTLSVVVK